MISSRARRWLRAGLLVALAVQTYLLYTPAPPTPAVALSGADLVAHVVLFGVPAALAWLLRPRWWVAAVLVAYAGGSEVLQRLVPHRSSDLADALADAVGVIAGVGIAWAVRRRASQPTHRLR